MFLPPLLSIIAFIALLLKLPGVMEFLGFIPCASCIEVTPWLSMIGGAYFATLAALLFLFPKFPNPTQAKAGLLWAIGLALTLSLRSSEICPACLIAHIAHISCWITLVFFPRKAPSDSKNPSLNFFMLFLTPLVAASFFLSLNLSLLLYSLPHDLTQTKIVKKGDSIRTFETPYFSGKNLSKATLLFFSGPNCPYCKELLPEINKLADEFNPKGYEFIGLSRMLTEELTASISNLKWIEDSKGMLLEQLGVAGYPTLILIDPNGRVDEVIAGGQKEAALKLRERLTSF